MATVKFFVCKIFIGQYFEEGQVLLPSLPDTFKTFTRLLPRRGTVNETQIIRHILFELLRRLGRAIPCHMDLAAPDRIRALTPAKKQNFEITGNPFFIRLAPGNDGCLEFTV